MLKKPASVWDESEAEHLTDEATLLRGTDMAEDERARRVAAWFERYRRFVRAVLVPDVGADEVRRLGELANWGPPAPDDAP